MILTYLIGFIFIAIAAKQIGKYASVVKLPYITGYLFAGMLAGPFLLDFIPGEATQDLRFIDELSLAVIAFVAGSELYLKELEGRLRVIAWKTVGILVATLLLASVVIFLLSDFLPFAKDMSTSSRIAIAILGSTVLLALSPASTIAVIKEARARGPFTKTILGVTVLMDVVVIIVFAGGAAVASVLLHGDSFNVTFLLFLALDLVLALAAGFVVGKLLELILATRLASMVKAGLILALGLGIFVLAFELIDISYDNLPFELHVEPLLVAMVGGFWVTNYSPHRNQFAEILHDISPLVYVAFFTLTGIALKLDVLLETLPIALLLFGVRVAGIFIGSLSAGALTKQPAAQNRISWMGFITQAGIALGLAREVAVEFPILGDDFATMIIAVVVLNEVVGPLFLKAVLNRMGESHRPETVEADQIREAVILGIEGQSMALARQLQANHWRVILADTDVEHIQMLDQTEFEGRHLPDISEATIQGLLTKDTDALVAVLHDDAANLKACGFAYEAGCSRLITRLNDLTMVEEFAELGAFVVDTASAMVNLLDQAIRAPQSAAMLMHRDPDHDFLQLTITDADVEGILIRDLRLPPDVLILNIMRKGQSVVPHGYTALHLHDEIVLIGKPESLETVTLRLGY